MICGLGLFQTITFNLKYFSFKDAIRFPVLLSRKVRLNKLGGCVKLGGPVLTGRIRMGFKSIGIFDYRTSPMVWDVAGCVVFKGTAVIGQGSKVCTGPDGTLVLGDNLSITGESTLVAYDSVQIGADCLLSWDVLIMDTDFHDITDENGLVINPPKPVVIGDHVWIGCKSLVLKGAVIPDASVIAANTFVSKALSAPGAVYVGSPAHCVKENVIWRK